MLRKPVIQQDQIKLPNQVDVYNDYEKSRKKGGNAVNTSNATFNEQNLLNMKNFRDDKKNDFKNTTEAMTDFN